MSEVEKCLEYIEGLRHELQSAMEAVARDSLTDLECSLWRQEMLSVGAKRHIVRLSTLGDLVSHRRVCAAVGALAQVNRTYEEVVKQGNRTVSLMQGLCSLYRSDAIVTAPEYPAVLSCEV